MEILTPPQKFLINIQNLIMKKIIFSAFCIAVSFSSALAVDENTENIEPRDPRGMMNHLLRVTQCAQIIAGDTQDPEQYRLAETKCLKVHPDWNGPDDGPPIFTINHD